MKAMNSLLSHSGDLTARMTKIITHTSVHRLLMFSSILKTTSISDPFYKFEKTEQVLIPMLDRRRRSSGVIQTSAQS